jgi:hypothetical protein
MQRYLHRQSSLLILFPLAAAAVAMLIAAALHPAASTEIATALLIALPIAGLVFAAFGALTISIDATALRWQFGWLGWPRKSIALDDIVSVETTRTRWREGWGIHRTRRGWLYNVAGFDAVLIRRRHGKAFLLGSDEPRRLAAALERAIERR